MQYKKTIIHVAIIFIAAGILNGAFRAAGNIPLYQHLSSDAELHIVHWRDYSRIDPNAFVKDEMFARDTRPQGELFMDVVMVRIGEFVGVDTLPWSVFVSMISLAIFLTGIYFLVSYSLQSAEIGFLVALGSVVPAFALGGTSWGFLAEGFLPRELAVGIAVWLLYLYFYGIRLASTKHIATVFIFAGILSNWYPVLFFHFMFVLLLADIICLRSIKKEHVLYGVLWAICAPFAFYDIFAKSSSVTPINISTMRSRFGYMLFDGFEYTFVRYLRRFIIYSALISGAYALSKNIFTDDENKIITPWRSIWLSSFFISIFGILIENYTPYTKFLFSRASLWFLFSSMVIVAYTTKAICAKKIDYFKGSLLIPWTIVLSIFLGQSSIPSIYRELKDLSVDRSDYAHYIKTIKKMEEFVPAGDLVLADPKDANKIRAYGNRGIYVSWKDGGISLLDGKGGEEWISRMTETSAVFQTQDFSTIKKFGEEHGMRFLFYREGEITTGSEELEKSTVFRAGPYGIAEF